MLERTLDSAPSDRDRPGSDAGGRDFLGYADVVNFVKRYAWTIGGSTLAAIVAATVYVVSADPIFTARSELLIDPKVPPLLREQAGEVSFSLDNAQIESQMAVLRSEKIAMMVIQQLDLTQDPQFQASKDSLFSILRPSF